MQNKIKEYIIGILATIQGYVLYLGDKCNPLYVDMSDYPAPFCWTPFNLFYKYICEHINTISYYSFCILIIAYLICYFYTGSKEKLWLEKLFKHIIAQDLGGDQYETRITLYVEERGAKFILQYLYFSLLQLIKNRTFKYFRTLPNPFSLYLRPYVRHSYPHKILSYTYFRAIKNDNDMPDSVVERCYVTGKVQYVSTTFIDDIKNMPKSIDQLEKPVQKRIKKYMEDTGISKYRKIVTLQRKPNRIYAFPVCRQQKIYGIVVIDNNDKENVLNLNDVFLNKIDNYQKIMQITINSL